MTQHSLTTRLDHSINTMLPETHGHQRKAFRDFVAAVLVVRTGCQATLARTFVNFEAASGRLTRWLHNPRVEPHAHAHAQAVVRQLPRRGTVRIAIDWTTEDQQHVLIASVVIGRRAVPLYWEAYTTAELKGTQRALEHTFVEHLMGVALRGLSRTRVLVTADRGFCTGAFLAQLDTWGVGFVLRLTANVTMWLDQHWAQLGHLPLLGSTDPGTEQTGALGVLALGQQSPLLRVDHGAGICPAV
jgi:hypothetical protein